MAEVSPMLSEHQAPEREEKKQTETYEPSPEERKLIKKVYKLLDKAKKHRAMYDKDWLDYYRMFRGRQWKESRPSYRHSEVVNLIFRSIQGTVPIQVDTRPRYDFIPQEPGDREVAEILSVVAEADWMKHNSGEELLEVVYDSNFYGTGISRTDGKPGAITYASADPFYTYPAPEARNTNKRCPYLVYAEPRDVGWIKRQHKDKAKYIKPDLTDLSKVVKAEDDIRFRSPADRNMVMEGTTPPDSANKDMALYIECFIGPEMCEDDFDEKEEPVKDHNGDPILDEAGAPKVEYVRMAKYPRGKKVTVCNNVLLAVEPGYDDGEIPFERYPNYVMPREFWGMSEVEQLAGPQRVFNKLVSFVLDVLTLTGNPIWLIPSTSGIDPDTLTNRPGLNVEFDGDTPPTRQEGAQLQPFVLQMIDRMQEWFDSLSGNRDVTQGVNPSGVTAASAIASLQEAAYTRLRQKARNLDFYLQTAGQHYKSRVFQFYSVPQIVRLTAQDGAAKYFRMRIEDTPRADGTTGKKLHVMPYSDDGKEDIAAAREYEIRGDFDVRVATGSSLPFAKAEKEEKLKALFQLGIIDEEEVLKGSDYPNYQAVLQRVAEKKQAAAQAEAQAQAG